MNDDYPNHWTSSKTVQELYFKLDEMGATAQGAANSLEYLSTAVKQAANEIVHTTNMPLPNVGLPVIPNAGHLTLAIDMSPDLGLELLKKYLQAIMSHCAVCGEEIEPDNSLNALVCAPCQLAVQYARERMIAELHRELKELQES